MNDIELNYTLTEVDYRRFNIMYALHVMPIFFLVPFIGILIDVMQSNSYLRANSDLVHWVSYYLSNLVFVFPILILAWLVMIFRAHIVFKKDKELSLPRRVVFSDVALTETTEKSNFILDYVDIYKVQRTKKLLIVYISGIRAILIPINSENEQTVQKIYGLLKEKGVKIK